MKKEDIGKNAAYSVSEMMEAAQCLWEAVLEDRSSSDRIPFLDGGTFGHVFDSMGTVEVRSLCRSPKTIEAMLDAYESLPDDHPLRDGFDWEFTPVFLYTCLDPDSMHLHEDWKDRFVDKANALEDEAQDTSRDRTGVCRHAESAETSDDNDASSNGGDPSAV